MEGLVNHDKGNTLKLLLGLWQIWSYSISYSVLNGKDFGLAQSRKRIYIIGFKSNTIETLENFEYSHSVLQDVIDFNTPPIDSDFSKKLLSKYDLKSVYGKG